MKQLTIDADGHVLEPREMWQEYIAPKWRDSAPRVERVDERTELLTVAGKPISPYSVSPIGALGLTDVDDYDKNRRGGFDPEARLVDMDSEGIDKVVLYPTLGLFMGGVQDPELALAIAQAYNDWLTDYCSAAPSRLYAAVMVPLQDIDLATQEVCRVGKRECFRAAFIRPNPYAGRTLETRAYNPLWSALADHDLAVSVHEGASGNMETVGADRYKNLFFKHIVSHTLEMQLAVLSIIGGGVPERFPSLRFAFLEAGGGWMAPWLNRMDDHFEGIYGQFVPWLKKKPSTYFARQCYVSFEASEHTLVPLVDVIGSDRIIFGSDYPHVDAIFPGYLELLRKNLAPLPEESQQNILHRNAARLYRLA